RGVNDRSIRVVLNEFRRRLEQLQFSVYVHQLCRPVRAAWIDLAAQPEPGSACVGEDQQDDQRHAGVAGSRCVGAFA
ncbi:hypothetical protein CCL19_15840, partial [Pseudomonas syringae]